MKSGLGYLSWGLQKAKAKADESGLTATVTQASQNAKQKADEYGITDAAKQGAKNVGAFAV